MKRARMFARQIHLFLALCLPSVLSPLFCETKIAGGTLSASLYSRQIFAEYRSALNPGSVFYSPQAYTGTGEYEARYRLDRDYFSVEAHDFGSVSAEKGARLTNRVGELILTVPIPAGYLDIGKKRIRQSAGYFKSPVDFGREKKSDGQFTEGRWMANAEIFTPVGFFGLTWMPALSFGADARRYLSSSQEGQYLLRYTKNVFGVDAGFALAKDDFSHAGVQAQTTLGEYVEVHGELVFHEMKDETELSPETLMGLTLNLKRMTGLFEYWYNRAGPDVGEWNARLSSYRESRANYDLNPANPLAVSGLARSFADCAENPVYSNSRHYALLRLSNPASDKNQAALTTVINLQDASGLIIPSFSFGGRDNITLSGKVSIAFGKEYSEFVLCAGKWNGSLDIELWL